MAERQVSGFESFEVPQHFVLGVVGVENRVGQVSGTAQSGLGNAESRAAKLVVLEVAHSRSAEQRHQSFDVGISRRLIQRNADRIGTEPAQVATGARGTFYEVGRCRFTEFNPNRIEEALMADR